jgi:hypothetical protein
VTRLRSERAKARLGEPVDPDWHDLDALAYLALTLLDRLRPSHVRRASP